MLQRHVAAVDGGGLVGVEQRGAQLLQGGEEWGWGNGGDKGGNGGEIREKCG